MVGSLYKISYNVGTCSVFRLNVPLNCVLWTTWKVSGTL